MVTLLWYVYLSFVALTSRIRVKATTDDSIIALRERRPVVYAFWYQHVLFLLYFFGTRKMPILLTPTGRSDRLIRLAGWMGMKVAKGTLEGGGRHALLTLLDTLKSGTAITIPADGSRGPERQPRAGTLILAQEAGAAIIPVAWRAPLRITIRRRGNPLIIPLPFNLIEVRLGSPLRVPKHDQFNELEGVKGQLAQQLNNLASS